MIVKSWFSLMVCTISLALMSAYIDQNDLVGSWKLQNKNRIHTDYPEIVFSENGLVTLSAIGDTIYRGKYQVCNERIIFTFGESDYVSRIVKSSPDTLVLHRLFMRSDTLTYIRKKP